MPNEWDPLEELTRLVRAHLPEGAFLRRDRDKALFVTDYDGDLPGFVQIPRGRVTALMPERIDPDPPPQGAFSASLLRFRGQTMPPQLMETYVRGVKCLGGCTEAEFAAFDRLARQAAAEALRTKAGGGVYALACLRDALAEKWDF